MALLELRRRAGQGELVVIIQPLLNVEMGLHPIQIALALGADDGLMPDLQPRTDRLKVGRRIGGMAKKSVKFQSSAFKLLIYQ